MKELICENCGGTYQEYPSKAERSRFCSKECKSQWESKNKTGKNNPNWSGGKVELVCENCGESFETNKYEKKNGRSFCSQKCAGEHRKEKMKGEKNPSWKGGKIEIECEWCGDTKKVTPAKKSQRFCSTECYMYWLSEKRKNEAWVGEDNPMWKDGASDDRRYGRNWAKQRKKAKKRDKHKCMLCDSKNDLVVHHKRPLRTFDKTKTSWWKEANKLNNLITLCRSCHSKIHTGKSLEELDPDNHAGVA